MKIKTQNHKKQIVTEEYNTMLLIPFSKNGLTPNKLFGVINNKIFVNLGKNIIHSTFCQNRLFVRFGSQISKSSSIHLCYLNVYL